MERPTTKVIRIGAWRVDTNSSQISRDGETARLELRTMRLLLCLAEHVGEVVSIDYLLDHIWNGVTVTSDSVYQAVTSLRRILGDDPKQPTYIATVPRFGYRMVATVAPWEDPTIVAPDLQVSRDTEHLTSMAIHTARFAAHRRTGSLLAACATLCLGLGISTWLFLFHGKFGITKHAGSAVVVPPSQKSVAVLPFLDLTEGMKQGEFTDGMTEELIDKLSKVPSLRVPSPTSSFYFKDKQVSVADVADKLGVAYVLDGSVRKSGARLRVAARLVRADTGYVIWSETYDRPWHYTLMIQDDIAGDLAEAVKASLGEPGSPRR
jgi:TolB-like protein/DNA-binding winged helix-turn-helix (wHTH) protein